MPSSRNAGKISCPAKPELGLEAVIPSWDLKFSISTPLYRYKSSSTHLSAPCESPHDYSEAISADEIPDIDKVIGTKSGRHWLCIIVC